MVHHIQSDTEETLKRILDSGSTLTIPANSGGARCNATFTYHNGSSSTLSAYSASGKYLNSGSTTSSAAENAIAAGCIVVASAGNNNMKISDKDDVDFGNWYGNQALILIVLVEFRRDFLEIT